ncbi:MAG: helix-turn-helix transcriptional regulator [Chitinophagaceae bacterium]|nr:helix-turn-helix transcriptional regulator [Chitinophagaceae bacterium]
MLHLHFKQILKARGIENPTKFLINAGLSRPAVKVLLYSENRSIRLDHIELLCTALRCTPNDILVWVADAQTTNVADHPLASLKYKEETTSFKETLLSLPLDQLKEAMSLLDNIGKENKPS